MEKMCKAIGVRNVGELFTQIPEELHIKSPLALQKGFSELELLEHLRDLGEYSEQALRCVSFLGGGSYRHFIPSFIGEMVSRGEFLTAYTPYQPEVSQGKLQLLYEFQTYIAMLSGMDVSNASLYDGATATAEAILMAHRIVKKDVVYVSRALHPNYRQVVKTYVRDSGIEMRELPFDLQTGQTLYESCKDDACAIVVGYPNYFGVVENLAEARMVADQAKALLVSVTAEALALALLKPPGEYGVDIFCGEGQSFGLPVSYGGPGLGLLATKDKYMRQMPGRIIGKGKDLEGSDAYLIVLATREQHIKREKATSNICTNEALCAIHASLYLSAYGKNLQALAKRNADLAGLLRQDLSTRVEKIEFPFLGPFFNEFVVRVKPQKKGLAKFFFRGKGCENGSSRVLAGMAQYDIFGGIDLSRDYPELPNCILVNVTEMNSERDCFLFSHTIKEVLR